MAKQLLDKIINIDGTEYSVTVHDLTIKTATGDNVVFDGSEPKTIEIPSVDDFISEIPSEYITESELNAKGYLTEHQPIKTINGESIIGTGNITITGGEGGGGTADTITVNTDFGNKKYQATITISKSSPAADGNIGDIWFKY